MALRAVSVSWEAVCSSNYINHVIVVQSSLDSHYRSESPQKRKSPEEPSYRRNLGWFIVCIIAKSKTTEPID